MFVVTGVCHAGVVSIHLLLLGRRMLFLVPGASLYRSSLYQGSTVNTRGCLVKVH